MNNVKNMFLCIALCAIAAPVVAGNEVQKPVDFFYLGLRGTSYSNGVPTAVSGAVIVYREPAKQNPQGYWVDKVEPQLAKFQSILTDNMRGGLFAAYCAELGLHPQCSGSCCAPQAVKPVIVPVACSTDSPAVPDFLKARYSISGLLGGNISE